MRRHPLNAKRGPCQNGRVTNARTSIDSDFACQEGAHSKFVAEFARARILCVYCILLCHRAHSHVSLR